MEMLKFVCSAGIGVVFGVACTHWYYKWHRAQQAKPHSAGDLEDLSVRMKSIFAFMKETDKLKLIERTVQLTGGIRFENYAENSWHLALFYILMERDLPEDVDKLKILKLLAIKSLSKLYAGDTPVYDLICKKEDGKLEIDQNKVPIFDSAKIVDADEKMAAAVKKLFAKLPADLESDLLALNAEYQQGNTLESQICAALSAVVPLIQNSVSDGSDYKQFKATYDGERALLKKYVDSCPALSKIGEIILDEALDAGWITRE